MLETYPFQSIFKFPKIFKLWSPNISRAGMKYITSYFFSVRKAAFRSLERALVFKILVFSSTHWSSSWRSWRNWKYWRDFFNLSCFSATNCCTLNIERKYFKNKRNFKNYFNINVIICYLETNGFSTYLVSSILQVPN